MTGSFQSEIETAVNLCKKGLCERFSILLSATKLHQVSNKDAAAYGPSDVVLDVLVFDVDLWTIHSNKLIDYGREEIQLLTKWFGSIAASVPSKISGFPLRSKLTATSARWPMPAF